MLLLALSLAPPYLGVYLCKIWLVFEKVLI